MYVLRVGIYGIICPDCNPDLNTSERHSQSPRVWTAYGTVPTYIWFIHTLPSYPILYHAIYANISALVWPGGGRGLLAGLAQSPSLCTGTASSSPAALRSLNGGEKGALYLLRGGMFSSLPLLFLFSFFLFFFCNVEHWREYCMFLDIILVWPVGNTVM